ncbi:MAG: diguanylate cyclase, partial [Acidimicrobiia bacterium]|nr:diguanylate cyclase [Acidimicrobiia bacterium]
GMSFRDLTPAEDVSLDQRALEELVSGQRDTYQAEKRYVRADGEVVWVALTVSVVRDRDAKPVHLISQMQDVTARKAAEHELAERALHDPLTGLPNRLLFTDRVQVALTRIERSGAPLSVFFIDLDRFKLVNDSLGHSTGDRMLVEVGARLRRAQTAALEGGDPDELREATKAEAGEVRALAGQARSILAEAGRGGSAAQEERLATTLRAAAVNDLAADLLRRGVLTEELSAAGFGFGIGEGDLPDEAFSARSTESREKQDRDDGERRRQKEREAKEQEANRRELRALEKELQAVRDTAVRLTQAADDAERRASEAREKAIDAAGRAERLAADVERLKRKGPKNE